MSPSPPSMPSISERDESSPIESTGSLSSDDSGRDEYPFFQIGDLESARSLGRYCETLSALKIQVSSHMAALDKLLEKDLQDRPDSPILHDASSAMAASLNRMSLNSAAGNGRQSRASSVSGPRSSSAMSFTEDGESEEKVRERKARIDRLKMNGWRRKRFDASRYEVLCDVVMAELNHG